LEDEGLIAETEAPGESREAKEEQLAAPSPF
jgi:hypothetical protein